MSDDEFRFFSLHRLPGRVTVDEVGWMIKCSAEEVHALTRAGLLKPLGNPPANGKKFYSTKQILNSLDEPNFLSRVTNALYRRWKDKNGSRHDKQHKLQNNHEHFTKAV